MHCWKCGTEIKPESGPLRILKHESCPKCDSDLHVCKNCRFYDPAAHHQCRETQAEWVRDKEKANYCDYFEPQGNSLPSGKTSSSASNAKSAFDKLFRDG